MTRCLVTIDPSSPQKEIRARWQHWPGSNKVSNGWFHYKVVLPEHDHLETVDVKATATDITCARTVIDGQEACRLQQRYSRTRDVYPKQGRSFRPVTCRSPAPKSWSGEIKYFAIHSPVTSPCHEMLILRALWDLPGWPKNRPNWFWPASWYFWHTLLDGLFLVLLSLSCSWILITWKWTIAW